MGLERLVLLLDEKQFEAKRPLAYIVHQGNEAIKSAIQLAERLRDELPAECIMLHCGEGSLKSQFKKADKFGAELAFILGDDEVAKGIVSIKFLRVRQEQQHVKREELVAFIKTLN
ncbi:MAG: hypothetical protein COB26_01380 [Piscirickettsiaceae bacterium]|nr:MAG: hypothetical protein COB26_01380 [Piscirickettsiaceae bacterium]